MTQTNQQCLNFKSLWFFLPLQLFNYLIFTLKTWCRRILIYKCKTNYIVLQESHSNFPCIFDSINVTSIDLTLLTWRIFSIIFMNFASIDVDTSIKSELGTRPTVARSWYCLAAINTWEEFALFKTPTKPAAHLLHTISVIFVRNLSRYINDDNGFLYCKQSLWAKNNYETSVSIRYLGRRRIWWV